MNILRAFLTAFSMYSRIPVPQVEWREENRRYALCFFPLVGLVCGGLLVLWRYVCGLLGFNELLFAAGGCVIPIIVSGGIHLDGYCDTCDALASCADKEKKLEIMKDSRIGAFGAIMLGAYFILQLGMLSMAYSEEMVIVLAVCFILSRSLSAMAAVSFRQAKQSGLLNDFAEMRSRSGVLITSIAYCAAALLAAAFISLPAALAAAAAAVLSLAIYRAVAYKHFGGVTGDLAGWFLQVCELMLIGSVVLSYSIMEVVA